jgi:hypothetical protein
MITKDKDYVFYEQSLVMMSKQPLSRSNATVVGTKNYIFLVPTKTIGMFLVLDTIKTHSFFQGVSIPQGVQKLIESSETVNDLEESLKALLQNDDKYVYHLPEWPSFKFKGFLGKHTLRISKGGLGANTSVMVEGKGLSKEFRAYYGQ